MHVLYVVGQGEGGLPHYTAELANAVTARHDVTVVKPKETTADDLFDPAVDVIEPFQSIDLSMSKIYSGDVDPRTFLEGMYSYDALERVADLPVDLVHEPTGLFPHVKFFMRYHGIDTEFPLIVTKHEVPRPRFSLSRPAVFLEELLNVAIPDVRADAGVVHTSAQKDALVDYGHNPESIEVIPHGSYSVFGTGTTAVDERDPSILFFGNLVPPKGIDTFVKAIPLVQRELPDVTAIVAGDGDLPAATAPILDAWRDTFEIHNHFIPNDAVGHFFDRAQVVALPYRDQDGTKGHSGVFSTATSFGTPVVASNVGMFPEYVRETGAGLVVDPENPARLADALVRVLRNDDERATMAANSETVAAELSWESVAEAHSELYERVLAEGDSPTVPL